MAMAAATLAEGHVVGEGDAAAVACSVVLSRRDDGRRVLRRSFGCTRERASVKRSSK